MEHETFWGLVCSAPHWGFELMLMVIFDLGLGVLLIPAFRKYILHHQSDDKKTEVLEGRVAQQEIEIAELRKHLGLPERSKDERTGKH